MVNREGHQALSRRLALLHLKSIFILEGARTFPQDKKTGSIVLSIFNAFCERRQTMNSCCTFTRNCCTCSSCVCLYQLCCLTCRADVDPFDGLQVGAKEDLALSECLWVRIYPFDMF